MRTSFGIPKIFDSGLGPSACELLVKNSGNWTLPDVPGCCWAGLQGKQPWSTNGKQTERRDGAPPAAGTATPSQKGCSLQPIPMPADAPSLAAGGPADAAGGTAKENGHPRVNMAASVPAEPEADSVVVLDDASPGHAATMALTDEAETVAAHAKSFSSNTKILAV